MSPTLPGHVAVNEMGELLWSDGSTSMTCRRQEARYEALYGKNPTPIRWLRRTCSCSAEEK